MKKGFTVLEFIIVMSIITIFVLLAVFFVSGRTEEASEIKIKNDIRLMSQKLDEYLILNETLDNISLQINVDELGVSNVIGLTGTIDVSSLTSTEYFNITDIEELETNTSLKGSFIGDDLGNVFYVSERINIAGKMMIAAAKHTPVTRKVFSSGLHTFVMDSNNNIYSFGKNDKSQLLTENYQTSYTISELNFQNLSEIKSTNTSTFAISNIGEIYSAGSNEHNLLSNGILGDNPKLLPVKINGTNMVDISMLETGTNHVLALINNGSILSWGLNLNGQIGDGTAITNIGPKQVIDINNSIVYNVTKVTAGDKISAALISNGTVLAWGDNSFGQMASIDILNTSKALRINDIVGNPLVGVKDIEAGNNYFVSLMEDGTVMSWGDNSSNQIGPGANKIYSPLKIYSEENVIQIKAGSHHTLILTESGKVFSIGNNVYGQLGDGSNLNKDKFTNVEINEEIESIEAAGESSFAVGKSGTVYVWGRNDYGQLGTSTNFGTNTGITLPVEIIN